MSGVIDDYLKAVERNLRLEDARKEHALRELRGHLQEKAADYAREDPTLPRHEAERRAVRDFGDASEVAAGYGADRSVVQPTGREMALRAGRAFGRGTRTAIKWTGISLAFLLVVSLVVGAWAYYEVKPIVEKNAPYPVYGYDQRCTATTCSTAPVQQRFDVYAGAREVRMDLGVTFEAPAGSVRITITDPNGKAVYDRTFTASIQGSSSTSEDARWAPHTGQWSVTYSYTGFQGTIHLDIYGIGLPPGTT